jgi:hypothetical protein
MELEKKQIVKIAARFNTIASHWLKTYQAN